MYLGLNISKNSCKEPFKIMEARGYVMPNYINAEMINKDSKCRLKLKDYQVINLLRILNPTDIDLEIDTF